MKIKFIKGKERLKVSAIEENGEGIGRKLESFVERNVHWWIVGCWEMIWLKNCEQHVTVFLMIIHLKLKTVSAQESF